MGHHRTLAFRQVETFPKRLIENLVSNSVRFFE